MRANHLSTADCRSILFFMLALLFGDGFLSDAANTADQVASSAQEARPIAVGAAVPDAGLRDLDGNDVTLHAIVFGRPTVLIFIRETTQQRGKRPTPPRSLEGSNTMDFAY